MEIWTEIAGFEGFYEVSDQGRIRSAVRAVRNTATSFRLLPAKMISPYIRPQGYATIRLSSHGKKSSHYVHRLVAAAFLGPGERRQEVCHRNGDKADNRAENLYWGTRIENMADRERLGESAKGERHGHAKLSEEQVRAIKADTRYQHIIAEAFGVSRRLIGMIKAGRVWRHLTDSPSN